MKKRMLKKSDVLREGYAEGYVQGLKKAQNIITKMLRESAGEVDIYEYIDSLPLEEIAEHLVTPETNEINRLTGDVVPVDTDTLYKVIESLGKTKMGVTKYTARDLMRFFDDFLYYEDVYDYNGFNGTDYADDDELCEEVDVILVKDGNGMLA